MVRTVAAKTRKAIVRAAQDGAEKIRTVAADAASAAAQAAAGVVLTSTSNALEAGRTQVAQSTPGVKKTLGRAVKRTIGVARPAEASITQDGQRPVERRYEKAERRNAGQNAGRGSCVSHLAWVCIDIQDETRGPPLHGGPSF